MAGRRVVARHGGVRRGLLDAERAAALIVLGVDPDADETWISFSFHNYQGGNVPDPHPRPRRRVRLFLSRFSTIFTGFFIGFFLQSFGVTGVFVLIAVAMTLVVVSIGGWGPRTRDLELEQISK